MPVALGLLVVVIYCLLEFVQGVHLLDSLVVFAIDGHVVGDVAILDGLLELDICAGEQDIALFLTRVRVTLTCCL